ncbi:unnamed protein product [Prorocentrum cordatum]|uniref:Uncharacterized protein n=1 Tax=Prorocentrum cordatum TaxID=2364126 RepID=A0ABN9V0S6_9DINO|nr:unnamed protein product [Polarella glacialis]
MEEVDQVAAALQLAKVQTSPHGPILCAWNAGGQKKTGGLCDYLLRSGFWRVVKALRRVKPDLKVELTTYEAAVAKVKAALQAGHQLLPHTPASAPSESEHRRLRPFVRRASAAALRPGAGEGGGEAAAASSSSPEPAGRPFSPPVAGLGRLLRTLSDLGTGGGHLSARCGLTGAGGAAAAAAARDAPLLDLLYDPAGNRFRELKHEVCAASSEL